MRLDVTGSRVSVARLFGLLILLVVLVTSHSFAQESLADTGMEISGLTLLTTAGIGRLWALLYMAGRKNRELIRTGPYSIMRHPLYAFNIVGAAGIGLASESLLILAAIMIFMLLYYPIAIRAEETKLLRRFGDAYLEYKSQVPALIPNLRLYHAPDRWEVDMHMFTRTCLDAIWFLWIFILLHGIESLHDSGVLPVLWKIS